MIAVGDLREPASQDGGHCAKRVRFEDVVMVDERDERAGRCSQRVGTRSDDAALFGAMYDLDARIRSCMFVEDSRDLGPGRPVVDEHMFPVGPALAFDRSEAGNQVGWVGVKDRCQHRDEWKHRALQKMRARTDRAIRPTVDCARLMTSRWKWSWSWRARANSTCS